MSDKDPTQKVEAASASEWETDPAAIYAWLQQLDPQHEQRQELLGAGIALHRAQALYPLSFDPVAQALIQRWNGVNFASSPLALGPEHDVIAETHSMQLASIVNSLGMGPQREEALLRGRANALSSALYPLVRGRGLASSLLSTRCASVLWASWTLLSRPELLGSAQRITIDQVLGWLGPNVLLLTKAEAPR